MMAAAALAWICHLGNTTPPPIVWSVAGSDSGGGAGIQADLHAAHALGAHPCTVPTALTAQNSLSVRAVQHADLETLRVTIGALEEDLPPKAVKLGMLGTAAIIREVASFVGRFDGPVVCDPVMITTSGARLLDEEAAAELLQLIAHCSLVTPNHFEAEALVGRHLSTPADVERAAAELVDLGCGAVLIKGGHAPSGSAAGVAQDYYFDGTAGVWLTCERIQTAETHGTGCTLSSAAASLLAHGYPMLDAVVLAKAYVTQGIRHATRLGRGPGPVAHTGFPCEEGALPCASPTAERGACRPRFARCAAPVGLLPVLDSSALVLQAIAAGVRDVQLRLKDCSADRVRSEIRAAQDACERSGARLWVNDHWVEALEAGCYGVHVGQEDLAAMAGESLTRLASAGLRLGVSTHSYAELAVALAVEPSYISLGPVFETKSKVVGHAPQGVERLRRWRSLVPNDTPLVAIGGIRMEDVPALVEAGAQGVAVIGALTRADDFVAAVTAWLEILPAM